MDGDSCGNSCGWSAKYTYGYINLLESRDLWPTQPYCISEVIEIAKMMPDPIPQERTFKCPYGYLHGASLYRSIRREDLDNLKNSIGLCLHCVKSSSDDSSYCRLQH